MVEGVSLWICGERGQGDVISTACPLFINRGRAASGKAKGPNFKPETKTLDLPVLNAVCHGVGANFLVPGDSSVVRTLSLGYLLHVFIPSRDDMSFGQSLSGQFMLT